ncbi:MAG: ATP-binding protein [bacterium]|nr:ATP-binding protein [bacterium]
MEAQTTPELRASTLAVEHLLLSLRTLHPLLRRTVDRQRAENSLSSAANLSVLGVSDEEAVELLVRAEQGLVERRLGSSELSRSSAYGQAEALLVERAARAGATLPLQSLADSLGLTAIEKTALLLCCAPEVDRIYERIYGYLHDDLNRRLASVELIGRVLRPVSQSRLGLRRTFGPMGTLRRCGVLFGYDAATELRQDLRLCAGVMDYLLSGCGDPARLFFDPREIIPTDDGRSPAGMDGERLMKVALALAEGSVEVVGVWGRRTNDSREAAMALLKQSGRRGRRLRLTGLPPTTRERTAELRAAAVEAAALGSVLWIETECISGPDAEALAADVAEMLVVSGAAAILVGRDPWRPIAILADRSYAELEAEPPCFVDRKTMWSDTLAEISDGRRHEMAAKFRFSERELQAVARVARTHASYLSGNGRPAPIEQHLDHACATVTQQRSHKFASIVVPRRGPADLVLPNDLHSQVMEIAQFHRSWPRVSDEWGLGRLVTGGGGIKVLFSGDSGTGKTLAAEVIAHDLGVPLIRVDLARVVSKWVGETEKNLSAAFEEAEESHAVLFFDEADALFGKRGEVQHGTDRYANLEVSYLLQRLEDSPALVILASNLKDNIDAAFTRRFQVTLHFPRPGEGERKRIWRIALPSTAPVSSGVDYEALSRLDMTGGSIVNSARTAALLAASQSGSEIDMVHVVRGVSRQYQREARLLQPAELGRYAGCVGDPS